MTYYYTYSTDTKTLTRAKDPLDGVIHPSAAAYAAIGAYPLAQDDPEPTPPEGKIAVEDGYTLTDNEWHRAWKYEDAPPPPPRTFSKRKLYNAFKRRAYWNVVRSFIESQGVWDDWSFATTLDEDDPLMVAAVAGLTATLGLTQEQMETILAECVAD